jgi:DNA-binding NarL/FixJ family response regulator
LSRKNQGGAIPRKAIGSKSSKAKPATAVFDRAGTSSNSTRPVRIVVADDHALLRELMVTLLKAHAPAFQVVADVDSTEAALQACQELGGEILLMDLNLASAPGGWLIAELRRRTPSLRILLYCGSTSDDEIAKALYHGIDGFISKGNDSMKFLQAIDQISRGDNYFCAHSSRLLAEIASGKHVERERERDCCLSPRETQILRLIANGETSKEIAAALRLSVATVDTHRRNAMAKIGARNAADLIRYGHQHGLLAAVPEAPI